MDQELASSIKKLNKENRHIILKIEQYLESRYINEVAGEEILSDIVGMALECQERNESFSNAIGGDSEAFCRELIRNSPRQSVFERILNVIHWLLLFSLILMPILFLVKLFFPDYSPAEISGLKFTVRLSYIFKYHIFMIVLVLGWFFVRLNTYRPMKYVIGIYIAVFMLFFLFTDAILTFFLHDQIVSFSILIYTLILAVLLVVCDLARRLFAMTVAYQKKKHSLN